MNLKIFTNQTTVRVIFFRYKPFFPAFTVIVVCVVLFVTFIIPQIQEAITVQNRMKAIQGKLVILNQNFTFASSLDQDALSLICN
jgi:uncharacterized membrane protein (DUF106 family)